MTEEDDSRQQEQRRRHSCINGTRIYERGNLGSLRNEDNKEDWSKSKAVCEHIEMDTEMNGKPVPKSQWGCMRKGVDHDALSRPNFLFFPKRRDLYFPPLLKTESHRQGLLYSSLYYWL